MYGTLEQLDSGRWQLRFTRILRHPPERVWRAISDPEHLRHWFPTTIDGERAAGARLVFRFPAEMAHLDPFEGEMLAYEPPSLMELRWGTDIVRIQLRPVDGGTELMLLDTLDEHGKAARDGAGWHACLDALAAFLDGEEGSRRQPTRWSDVHGHYVESFGPEAAAIGPPEGVS